LLALVVSVLLARPSLGEEDASAAITSLFLDGSRARIESQVMGTERA
jgi:hypothetical protein